MARNPGSSVPEASASSTLREKYRHLSARTLPQVTHLMGMIIFQYIPATYFMCVLKQRMDKVEQISKVSDAIKSTKELEKNYVSHLFTFMAMSKKLQETTQVLDAVSKSLDSVSDAEIKDVQATKARVHKSISMVRNEFLSQVTAMMKNPNYGDDLKNRLSALLADFKSIDSHTKPKGVFSSGGGRGGGNKKAAPKKIKNAAAAAAAAPKRARKVGGADRRGAKPYLE